MDNLLGTLVSCLSPLWWLLLQITLCMPICPSLVFCWPIHSLLQVFVWFRPWGLVLPRFLCLLTWRSCASPAGSWFSVGKWCACSSVHISDCWIRIHCHCLGWSLVGLVPFLVAVQLCVDCSPLWVVLWSDHNILKLVMGLGLESCFLLTLGNVSSSMLTKTMIPIPIRGSNTADRRVRGNAHTQVLLCTQVSKPITFRNWGPLVCQRGIPPG